MISTEERINHPAPYGGTLRLAGNIRDSRLRGNDSKINLLNFDLPSLRQWFQSIGEKPFHANQVFQWIHQQGLSHIEKMTNLSQTLRTYLIEHTIIQPPEIAQEQLSQDGTRKWLLRLSDGEHIEMVCIPEEHRGTLCISSQVGCPLGCLFCATGKQGFKRNLEVSEIIGQVWLAVRLLSSDQGKHDHHITNVVLMGMGEPLLNFDNVVKATNIMMDDLGYGLSKYRVTISTVGIIPALEKLLQVSSASLAVSLHAPQDELRSKLMPINREYPLALLMSVCKKFFQQEPRRKIAFEYILLKNVNDSPEHAHQLVKLISPIRCKVNLIPCNAVKSLGFEPSPTESIERFQKILTDAGIITHKRKTRGSDIDAACGQLAGLVSL